MAVLLSDPLLLQSCQLRADLNARVLALVVYCPVAVSEVVLRATLYGHIPVTKSIGSGGKGERMATRSEAQEPVVLITTVILTTTVVSTTN